MYLFFVIIPILLILLLLNHWRKKKIIKKVCCMCPDEKYRLLNELLEPFGYYYIASQDIFSSRVNAWQRELGYSALYDKAAIRFRMVFDSLPVYFDYQGRTWLLEFWKGQYGITTGGEIGLYYADRIIGESERDYTLFKSVEDADMIKMSFTLMRRDRAIAQPAARHWWLTAFCLGRFSQPWDLIMHTYVTFPSTEMATAFVHRLTDAGYQPREIYRRYNVVSFSFDRSEQPTGFFRRLRIKLAQKKNRFWCKLYLFITRPFCTASDRVLYLYFYLPFVFRKTLRIRKYKKCKPRRK